MTLLFTLPFIPGQMVTLYEMRDFLDVGYCHMGKDRFIS